MVRLLIALLCAAAACMLVAGAFSFAQTTTNFTPDPFVAQVSHSARDSFAGDMSANGRFVVIESTGDIATDKSARNNQDGNREIFLYDYAQRRIFQITDTKSILKPPGTPSPTPTPTPTPSQSASPTPTATPTPTPPVDNSTVAIEISNNRPIISLDPTLVSGQRTYTIVFSSNSPTLATFDGTDPGAPTNTDMNQELWTYQFTVPEVADLSTGAEVGPIDLTGGTFTRITNTPASFPPQPGSTTRNPQVADDNRDATISDDGRFIALVSSRDLVTGGNVDTGAIPNSEIFVYDTGTGTFEQVTNTKTASLNFPIFNENPSISGDGTSVAFVSNANFTGDNNDTGNGNGNAEIFLATGAGYATKTQVTKTKDDASTGATSNIFSFGRRLSRDGSFIAFESLASDPGANGTNTSFYVSFLYNVAAKTFAQVGPRALATPGDVLHFPTFTDYTATTPGSVVFASALNFKSDGTFPTSDQDSTGLNPPRASQVFLAPIVSGSVASTGPFTRLTNIPTGAFFVGIRPFLSNSRKRMAFSLPVTELGGGNGDGSSEVYYHLSPTITTESTATLSLFTGASMGPVFIPSPTTSPSGSPTPTPTPTPSPSPSASPTPFLAPGLAPGELAIAKASFTPAPTAASVSNNNASESGRAPSLPIELSGVSVSINGAACALYSVDASQINFVVPIGLVPNSGSASYPIVINNNGTVIRGLVVIVSAQPDIFMIPPPPGPGGRAVVCNVTNPLMPGCLMEPFNVTSDDGTGTQVPTVLRISLTGVRGSAASSATVTVGTTVITASTIVSSDLPGFDQLNFILPSTVDRGDLPIVVKVNSASSRPSDTAPHITINP